MSGTSAPYRALLKKRKSPMRRGFSMLPEGIRNASTRNVRRKNQTTRATMIDLAQSQAQMTREREEWAAVRAVMAKEHPQMNGSWVRPSIYHDGPRPTERPAWGFGAWPGHAR